MIVTVVLTIVILAFEIISMYNIVSLEKVENEDFAFIYLVTGVIFLVLGVGFLIYGVLTIYALKIFFNDFFRENRCLLIFASFTLSVPLLIRGILTMLISFIPEVREYIIYQRLNYEIFMYIVGTVIPLSS